MSVAAGPFDRRLQRRVPVRTAQARLFTQGNAAPSATCRVTNASLEGLAFDGAPPLGIGSTFDVDVAHPVLGALPVVVRVAWWSDGRVGVQLAALSILQRSWLRRLMAAELGSAARDPQGKLVGFLLPIAAHAWAVCDPSAARVGVIESHGAHATLSRRPRDGAWDLVERVDLDGLPAAFQLAFGVQPTFTPALAQAARPVGPRETTRRTIGGTPAPAAPAPAAPAPAAPAPAAPVAPAAPAAFDPSRAPTVGPQPLTRRMPPKPGAHVSDPEPAPPPPAAAAPARPGTNPPSAPKTDAPGAGRARRLDPPKEPEAAPSSMQGSAVLDVSNGETVGFVALTGKRTWSVYDPDQVQTAVLTQEQGRFTIFWLGASPEDSLEAFAVESYPDALAAAFDLSEPPRLKSVIITPRQASSRTAADGVRVLFRFRRIGTLLQEGDGWKVLDKRKRLVATLTPADGLWRLVPSGASPEDSFPLDGLDDLVTAVAVALELPGPPSLDPAVG